MAVQLKAGAVDRPLGSSGNDVAAAAMVLGRGNVFAELSERTTNAVASARGALLGIYRVSLLF